MPERSGQWRRLIPGAARAGLVGAAVWGMALGPVAGVVAQGTPETEAQAPSCWTSDQVMEGDDSVGKQYAQAPAMRIDPAKTYTATLETNKGTVEVELFHWKI